MKIGEAELEFLGHSGFIISFGTNGSSKRIAIDPYMVSLGIEKVDYILITHGHYDHCSIEDITKLAKSGSIIIVPADVQSKITKIDEVHLQVIEVGDELTLGNIKIEAIPAYNVSKDFHPKSEGWMGYVVKFANTVIYHAGDSDSIPEMQRLSGYGKKGVTFIALLPVSGNYVMDFEQAAKTASLLNPDVAIPMHYGSGVIGTLEDAKNFVKVCESLNVKAVILEKK
ncbi:MAG: MBL fold metallo-hydrolase [Nanoarchaeota archaeon]